LSFARASESVRRKADHVKIALEEEVEFASLTTGLERYKLVYEALPEIDLNEVDLSTTLLGKHLQMPLIISPITGGTPDAARINRVLAEAAQQFGLAMGVGSQRVALEEPDVAYSFQVRKEAPDILLFANLGAIQLNNDHGLEGCRKAVEMIDADALMLHLNPLQECVQWHGNTNFRNLASQIATVCDGLEYPVVAKEVGHGISARSAKLLAEAGVVGIDVAGAGGTSWAKVESFRDKSSALSSLGTAMGEWGIPTAESLLAVKESAPMVTTIASGGIRTGTDIAKCLALGADAVGMALPLLRCAASSAEALHEKLALLREELSVVMMCVGCRNVAELRNRGPAVLKTDISNPS
jgi:isopentenyl-diphosphate delta-isomerase